MPAAVQYELDKNTDEYRQIEEAYSAEVTARAEIFRRNWDYYDGLMPNPLKIGKDKIDDNIILPKIGQITDKTVSFLLGDGVDFDASGDGEQDAIDDSLAELWAANRKQVLLHNMALSGTLSGHCWARIEPRENMQPRIVNLNPANCSAFWDVADVGRVLWYRLQFQAGDDGPGKRLDYVHGRLSTDGVDHDVDEWWELVFTTKGGASPEWVMQKPRAWPYAWAPLTDWQNLPRAFRYYGLDDISLAIRLNQMLNFVLSNWSRILKHHAYPKTVGLGFDAGDMIETEIGGFFTVNKSKADADIYNLEMESDLSSSRALAELLAAEIWHVARMVDPASIKDKIGDITNFALRVLYSDAIKKIETKRLLYGEGLEELSMHGLELQGIVLPDTIAVIWPEVLPEDDAEITQRLLSELEAGIIDKQTYREKVGYDHEQIIQRLAEQGTTEDNLGARLLSAFETGR